MIVKRELGSQLSQCTEMGLTVFAYLSLGLAGSVSVVVVQVWRAVLSKVSKGIATASAPS